MFLLFNNYWTYDCSRQSGHSTAVPRSRDRLAPLAHAVAASSCTQAAHPREFHRVLDDGAAIAEAIADLDVQHLKPRVFRPRGPSPSKN